MAKNKKLYRFPNAKMALYATERDMTNMCTAIEQEVLAKYEGRCSVSFEVFSGKLDDYHLLGEALCMDVFVRVDENR